MDTFINYMENRKNQVDAIKQIMTKLYYEKGIGPEDIVKMDTSDLRDLIKDMSPTESWSNNRFAAMLKHVAGLTLEWVRSNPPKK